MPSLTSFRCCWTLPAVLIAGACGTPDAPAQASAVRDTLADGTVRVRYASLPSPTTAPLESSLSIGVMDGEPYEILGNVRGIEASADGTIYILDHQASEVRAFDADGRFLRLVASRGQRYGVARLDERGDTILVLEVDIAPLPVTEEDRAKVLDEAVDRSPDRRRAAEAVLALAPDTKPVLDQLIMDDVGRLWVRRVLSEGETTVYDIFTRDAEYVGSVHLAFKPASYFPPKIRDGRLYTLALDSLDVQTVVRVDVARTFGSGDLDLP